jgi:hypothetical protein
LAFRKTPETANAPMTITTAPKANQPLVLMVVVIAGYRLRFVTDNRA